ncbi:hypothetical protein CCUS01_14233, partial [Colletotrichum cuscutae]
IDNNSLPQGAPPACCAHPPLTPLTAPPKFTPIDMAWLSASLRAGESRLYFLCIFFGIGASVWGYNIGILSSVIVSSGWREALHQPTRALIGTVVSIYYTGTFISYLCISHPITDWLGRRYAALSGTAFVCLGAILQATSGGSTARGTMLAGRLISGVGVAVVSTSVPLYQAEISPAHKRGHFVTLNHVGFIAGIALGFWVGYFMRFWSSDAGLFYGWRLTILLEIIPAMIFGLGLPWVPETPRWLVEHGRKDQARSTLRWLREGSFDDDEIEHEFSAIIKSVDEYHQSGSNWLSLFRQKPLFNRLWRATLLQFMASSCGATAIKYFLPWLLEQHGIFSHTALLISATESTVKIGFTVLEMFIIDRFGRRKCLVAGCIIMAFSLLINGAVPLLDPQRESPATDIICVAFIFVYVIGFSLGFGPTAWVYNTEIFPTSVRARGLNFASAGASVGSSIVTMVWSAGIGYMGSNIYFIFMVVNIICIPAIYAFFPETKGRELEDMDALFGAIETRRSDFDNLSEHLLQDDAPFRDSVESATGINREQDRD